MTYEALARRVCDWCGGAPVRDNLDGDDLCQSCCDKWVRGEGEWVAEQAITAASLRAIAGDKS